jgi:hypothetical protein
MDWATLQSHLVTLNQKNDYCVCNGGDVKWSFSPSTEQKIVGLNLATVLGF